MSVASRIYLNAAGHKALALALLFTISGARSAAADLIPAPIPECVGKPDGTFCKLADGTAGQCQTTQDTRRPGRSYQNCTKDHHECDRLAIGAECHGYLGKTAHCREFTDPEKHTTWRTCQSDAVDSAAPLADQPAAAAQTPATPSIAVAAGPVQKRSSSCAAAPGGAPSGGFSLLGLSLLLFAARRRHDGSARRAGPNCQT